MPRLRVPFALVALCLSAAPVSDLRAQEQPVRYELDEVEPALEETIRRELAKGTASVSIAVVQGEQIVWTAAYGDANATTGTPATPATIYSTGSTGKSITATAVMQLVEAGEVDLDEPANRYLDGVRIQDRLQADQPVTVRDLLSHTSGLTCEFRTRPVFSRSLPPNLAELTERTYSVRPPGVEYEYCNAAYGIAGYLVEQVSGEEYEEYIVNHVLKPVGATTPAPVRPTAEMAEVMARTYDRGEDGTPQPVRRVFFDVYPAGDLYLTAVDMARYLGAHLNGGAFGGSRILSEASVREMRRPHVPRPPSPDSVERHYGLGFVVEEAVDGHTIIAHGGTVFGMNAHLIGDVEARLGVYVMTNSAGHEVIARRALELFRGAPLQAEGDGVR